MVAMSMPMLTYPSLPSSVPVVALVQQSMLMW